MIKVQFNPHVAALTAPAIPQALSWAKSYDGASGPLIDLSQAVPNYPPHPDMLERLAFNSGSDKSAGYGEIEGEPILRERYALHVNEIYGSQLESANIHITSGCNQAFVATLMALTQAGDRVILTNPCYFNHEATANMLGLDIAYAPCEQSNAFLPSLDTLLPLLTESVRVLALVSPNNPTGAVYPPDLLASIFSECQRRGIWLILDETYRDFLPASYRPCHQLFSNDNWQHTFVQLYSFSKALCIPGHRLGALAAGPEVVQQIAKVMDNLQICAPRAAQQSTAELLRSLDDWRASNLAEISSRAEIFLDTMAQIPRWKVASIGAYFAYVEHPFRDMASTAVVQRMAQHYGVLPLPGEFFGFDQNDFIRVAFANVDGPTLENLAPDSTPWNRTGHMSKRTPPRLLTVVTKKYISKNLLRITFGGENLIGFPPDSKAASVKLLLAHPDQDWDSYIAALAGIGEKPLKRTYTVLAYRQQANELDIDIALHDNPGPATRWAIEAKPGDSIALAGPGNSHLINTNADWFLLAGDMAALPAIVANIQTLPDDARGYIVIEVIGSLRPPGLTAPSHDEARMGC